MEERIIVCCTTTWPAKVGCSAWGAPGPHGCRLKPGHEGRCICACHRRCPDPPAPKPLVEVLRDGGLR